MNINESENEYERRLKKLYIKLVCLYIFYCLNLMITILIINFYNYYSCIVFNLNLYVDIGFKSLIILHIFYVYFKRKYNINFIFIWKYVSCLSFFSYPLFLFIVMSEKGWNGICPQFNPLFIYICILSSAFFFVIFRIGNTTIFIQENNECVICLDNILLQDKVRIDSCGHIFHRNCILTWFLFNNSCPVCRIRSSPSDLRSP